MGKTFDYSREIKEIQEKQESLEPLYDILFSQTNICVKFTILSKLPLINKCNSYLSYSHMNITRYIFYITK